MPSDHVSRKTPPAAAAAQTKSTNRRDAASATANGPRNSMVAATPSPSLATDS
ncbi:hypothetical protein [Cryobacterium inferilacus]|uniref:hypothetical protein n=1 Tax=Cryobacterium inferilacus TaxID=2866629 RepID=UPI0021032987|nr:hypothetical protein [Cryobacterium sp. 1639]